MLAKVKKEKQKKTENHTFLTVPAEASEKGVKGSKSTKGQDA